MNAFLLAVLGLIVLKTGTELWLDWLNRKQVLANRSEIPPSYRGRVDEETYRRAVDYTLARNRFSIWETLYEAVVLALILVCGVLPWLFYGISSVLGMGVWGQALVLFLIMILISLPSLPFEWWSTFKLEARYGFNKTTLGLWITDKIKGIILGLLLGYPLLCLLLWFFQIVPNTWWVWGFFAFFGFQILLLLLYPRLILPLFNKLTPLPEGELRERLLKLGERTGFTAQTIQVMDGSRRSTHSNAFFTGFGRFRRIVLFDTLIEQLEPVELEAVLAHEIGHYKLGHIPKMLVVSALSSFLGFAALGWIARQPWFYESFGFRIEDGMVPALILFGLLAGLVTFWLSPVLNRLSRKHEYEADAFACEAMGTPDPLIQSLRKLHGKNLSNFTPHPIYSAFHYSHPSLLEREAAMVARGE